MTYVDIDFTGGTAGSYVTISYPPSSGTPAPTVTSVTGLASPLYQWSVSTSTDLAGVVNGTDFSGVTSVTVGGIACTITAQTATTIDITIPSGELASSPLHTAGAKDVVVTQPSGSGTLVGGVTVTAWTPATPSGDTAWWAADDVSESSGVLSQMNDKSGNARHLSQGTPGNRPTYTASDADFGNLPSVTFDGADDFLDSAVAANLLMTTTAKTVFAVVRTASPVSATNNTTTGAGGNLYNNDVIWGDVNGYVSVPLTSGGPLAWCYNYDTNVDGASVSVAANTKYALTYVHNGSTVSIRSGLGAAASASSGTTGNALAGVIRVGRYASSTNYAAFKLVELVTYNVELPQGERDRLAARAIRTWGI